MMEKANQEKQVAGPGASRAGGRSKSIKKALTGDEVATAMDLIFTVSFALSREDDEPLTALGRDHLISTLQVAYEMLEGVK
jgi:hypothetical protein